MKLVSQLKKTGTWSFHIPIPAKEGKVILEKFGKRILLKINGEQIHCAIQNSKQIGLYISISKASRKKFNINFDEKISFEILKDESKYQIEISEEFEEVLKTDIIAEERFNALTPGKQRSLIHYISKAKNIDTRINRALKIADNLKMGKKDLKELLSS